jgi:Tol biopolymer transport system component
LHADELRRQRVRGDGSPRGEAEVVQTGVLGTEFSESGTGERLVYTRDIRHANVVMATERAPASGRFATVSLTEGTALRQGAALSPDGARIAYAEERGGASDLFVVPAAGGTARQVTTGGKVAGSPAWSPSGEFLAYVAVVQHVPRVVLVAADAGQDRVFASTQVGEGQVSWEPGRDILYQGRGNHNFSRLDVRTGAESALVRNPEVGWMFRPKVSPDGKLVALDWNRVPQPGVWVVALGDTTQRLVVARSGRGLVHPVGWSADGKGVYVRRFSPDDIALYPLGGGSPRRTLTLPTPRAECEVRETSRGIRMACVLPESQSDAWLMEGFDGRRR